MDISKTADSQKEEFDHYDFLPDAEPVDERFECIETSEGKLSLYEDCLVITRSSEARIIFLSKITTIRLFKYGEAYRIRILNGTEQIDFKFENADESYNTAVAFVNTVWGQIAN